MTGRRVVQSRVEQDAFVRQLPHLGVTVQSDAAGQHPTAVLSPELEEPLARAASDRPRPLLFLSATPGCRHISRASVSRASAAPAILTSAVSGPSPMRSNAAAAPGTPRSAAPASSGSPQAGSARCEATRATRAWFIAWSGVRTPSITGTASRAAVPTAWKARMLSADPTEVHRMSWM